MKDSAGKTNAINGPALTRILVYTVCVFALSVTLTHAGQINNGDFSTGDLTGWTTSAIDDNDNEVSPAPIAVTSNVAGNFAELSTVAYSNPPGFAPPTTSLSQEITLTGNRLAFDLAFETTTDSNETDDGFFSDTLEVLLDDGSSQFTLLVFDGFNLDINPFGETPGLITSSASNHPLLSDRINLQINLNALASNTVTLEFTLVNELDGHASLARVARVVPEPTTALLILGAFGLCGFKRSAYRF